MLDPLPLRNPPWLQELVRPFADFTGLVSLPAHIHEVLFAFAIYQFTLSFFSPLITQIFFAKGFAKFDSRTRFNWHVHVVAFVQSVIICAMALWVRFVDKEWAAFGWQERVYGYTGSMGLIQAFAAGYFLWDFYICVRYIKMFGVGMLAHAISGLTVYSFGFRPLVNGYTASFILYEISSPFLNIHWFCDKLGWTGGNLQFVNGIFLLITFAGARLVYGSLVTYSLFKDLYTAVAFAKANPNTPPLALSPFALNATTTLKNPLAALQVVKYAPATADIPLGLVAANVLSALTLVVLNFYWYSQMVSAIRKRFDPPFGTRRKVKADEDLKVSEGTTAGGKKKIQTQSTKLRRQQPVRLESTGLPPPTS